MVDQSDGDGDQDIHMGSQAKAHSVTNHHPVYETDSFPGNSSSSYLTSRTAHAVAMNCDALTTSFPITRDRMPMLGESSLALVGESSQHMHVYPNDNITTASHNGLTNEHMESERTHAGAVPYPALPIASLSTSAYENEDNDHTTIYSSADLPVLDTHIPDLLLPDDLYVHDEDSIIPTTPIRYVRVDPESHKGAQYAYPARDPRDTNPPRLGARLFLAEDGRIAGGHSTAIRAAFEVSLPAALNPDDMERARVVAKVPATTCGAFHQLHQEARMYHAFPKELAQEHTAVVKARRASATEPSAARTRTPGVLSPVYSDVGSALSEDSARALPDRATGLPRTRTGSMTDKGRLRSFLRRISFKKEKPTIVADDGVGSESTTLMGDLPPSLSSTLTSPGSREAVPDSAPRASANAITFPPVVPKFYGYYLPLRDDGNVWFETHNACGEEGICDVNWPAPILLMEDCGSPVQPWLFVREQRLGCFALVKFLHDAGFVHEASTLSYTYATAPPAGGKMLVQPGPLCVPREARSYREPSFRVVGFGRGNGRTLSREAAFWRDYEVLCERDYELAWRALGLEEDVGTA